MSISGLHHRLDLAPVADVTCTGTRAAKRLDLSRGRFARLDLSADDHDVGTASAKARTISRPNPRLPPVTSAVFPVRSNKLVLMLETLVVIQLAPLSRQSRAEYHKNGLAPLYTR